MIDATAVYTGMVVQHKSYPQLCQVVKLLPSGRVQIRKSNGSFLSPHLSSISLPISTPIATHPAAQQPGPERKEEGKDSTDSPQHPPPDSNLPPQLRQSPLPSSAPSLLASLALSSPSTYSTASSSSSSSSPSFSPSCSPSPPSSLPSTQASLAAPSPSEPKLSRSVTQEDMRERRVFYAHLTTYEAVSTFHGVLGNEGKAMIDVLRSAVSEGHPPPFRQALADCNRKLDEAVAKEGWEASPLRLPDRDHPTALWNETGTCDELLSEKERATWRATVTSDQWLLLMRLFEHLTAFLLLHCSVRGEVSQERGTAEAVYTSSRSRHGVSEVENPLDAGAAQLPSSSQSEMSPSAVPFYPRAAAPVVHSPACAGLEPPSLPSDAAPAEATDSSTSLDAPPEDAHSAADFHSRSPSPHPLPSSVATTAPEPPPRDDDAERAPAVGQTRQREGVDARHNSDDGAVHGDRESGGDEDGGSRGMLEAGQGLMDDASHPTAPPPSADDPRAAAARSSAGERPGHKRPHQPDLRATPPADAKRRRLQAEADVGGGGQHEEWGRGGSQHPAPYAWRPTQPDASSHHRGHPSTQHAQPHTDADADPPPLPAPGSPHPSTGQGDRERAEREEREWEEWEEWEEREQRPCVTGVALVAAAARLLVQATCARRTKGGLELESRHRFVDSLPTPPPRSSTGSPSPTQHSRAAQPPSSLSLPPLPTSASPLPVPGRRSHDRADDGLATSQPAPHPVHAQTPPAGLGPLPPPQRSPPSPALPPSARVPGEHESPPDHSPEAAGQRCLPAPPPSPLPPPASSPPAPALSPSIVASEAAAAPPLGPAHEDDNRPGGEADGSPSPHADSADVDMEGIADNSPGRPPTTAVEPPAMPPPRRTPSPQLLPHLPRLPRLPMLHSPSADVDQVDDEGEDGERPPARSPSAEQGEESGDGDDDTRTHSHHTHVHHAQARRSRGGQIARLSAEERSIVMRCVTYGDYAREKESTPHFRKRYEVPLSSLARVDRRQALLVRWERNPEGRVMSDEEERAVAVEAHRRMRQDLLRVERR